MAIVQLGTRLVVRIKLGASLFRKVMQTRLDGRDQAFAAWRAWAIGLRDLLENPGPLRSLVTMMFAISHQEHKSWSNEQLSAVLSLLNQWRRNPTPARGEYERWRDELLDRGIRVRPW